MTKLPTYKINAKFAPETRFNLAPAPAASRSRMELQLDMLKEQLLAEIFLLVRNPERHALLRSAADAATSLAWATPFPLLVLPVLLEEKTHAAMEQAARQHFIHRRSRQLLSLAA